MMGSPRIRPGKFWFVIAALIAVGGVVLGVGIFVVGLVSGLRDFSVGQEFAVGQTVTVHLVKGEKKVIWVREPVVATVRCSSERSTMTFKPTSENITYGNRGATWKALFDLTTSETGDYPIICEPTGNTDSSLQFATGTRPDVGAFAAKLGGGIVALTVLPCGGVVLGVIIALVVAFRRGAARKRLQTSSGFGPGGYSGGGYPGGGYSGGPPAPTSGGPSGPTPAPPLS